MGRREFCLIEGVTSFSSSFTHGAHSGIGSGENTPRSLFLLDFVLFLVLHSELPPVVSSQVSGRPPNGFTMQSMQRKFGRMTSKRSADDSQVAVLMKDFEDADNLLSKVGSLILVTRVPTDSPLDHRVHQSLARCLDLDCNLSESHDRRIRWPVCAHYRL